MDHYCYGVQGMPLFEKVDATKTRPIRQCRKQLSYKEQPDSPDSNTDDFGTCGVSLIYKSRILDLRDTVTDTHIHLH